MAEYYQLLRYFLLSLMNASGNTIRIRSRSFSIYSLIYSIKLPMQFREILASAVWRNEKLTNICNEQIRRFYEFADFPQSALPFLKDLNWIFCFRFLRLSLLMTECKLRSGWSHHFDFLYSLYFGSSCPASLSTNLI